MANSDSLNIVLVHGFPGFPKLGKFEYFNGVDRHLKRNVKSRKINISIPRLGAFDEISARAEKLEKDIKKQFKQGTFTGEKVHIIAHSGGGLDARWLASPGGLGRADLVASITTISAPHHGALAADLLVDKIPEPTDDVVERLVSNLPAAIRPLSSVERLGLRGANQADRLLNKFRGSMEDTHENMLERFQRTVLDAAGLVKELTDLQPKAVRGFTTKEMKKFNDKVVDADGVTYNSYAGVSGLEEEDSLAPLFYASHLLLLLDGERNDGWITVKSAKWTKFKGKFKGEIAADHADQVGHDLSLRGRVGRILRPPSFDHLAFYEKIVRELPDS